jgi:hypothetical protein
MNTEYKRQYWPKKYYAWNVNFPTKIKTYWLVKCVTSRVDNVQPKENVRGKGQLGMAVLHAVAVLNGELLELLSIQSLWRSLCFWYLMAKVTVSERLARTRALEWISMQTTLLITRGCPWLVPGCSASIFEICMLLLVARRDKVSQSLMIIWEKIVETKLITSMHGPSPPLGGALGLSLVAMAQFSRYVITFCVARKGIPVLKENIKVYC